MRTLTLTIAIPHIYLPAPLGDALARARNAAVKGFGVLTTWQRRHDQRRQLGELDRRLIIDAGLTPEIIARETAKPFWRA